MTNNGLHWVYEEKGDVQKWTLLFNTSTAQPGNYMAELYENGTNIAKLWFSGSGMQLYE